MRCASCGHEGREEALFCEGCGARMRPACPSCGGDLAPGAKFCDRCGGVLSEDLRQYTASLTEPAGPMTPVETSGKRTDAATADSPTVPDDGKEPAAADVRDAGQAAAGEPGPEAPPEPVEAGEPSQVAASTSVLEPVPSNVTQLSVVRDDEMPGPFQDGRYKVERLVGEGAKKKVYFATDGRLNRGVALAIINTAGLSDYEIARIRREVQAMAWLGDHPNIVTIHDIGEEERTLYIVSQFMEGGDLDSLVRSSDGGRLPIARAVQIGSEIGQALAHAHEKGIIHRDVKPGNIWLTGDGTAKLGDFGLAMVSQLSRITLAGTRIGTPAYMAPECAMGGGRDADARSDVYSLGAVMYEMVTGRPPFTGRVDTVIADQLNKTPERPSVLNSEVPATLERLILRMLAKRPADRPESANSALTELNEIARSMSLRPVTKAAPVQPHAVPAAIPSREPSAAEKPAAEKPVAEKPAAEKPVAEKPAEVAAATEPSAAESPGAVQPAADQPAAEPPPTELPAAAVSEEFDLAEASGWDLGGLQWHLAQPLAGRTAERATVLAAVDKAVRGDSSVLLFRGGQGRGKSRLAAEAAALAKARAATVAVATASPSRGLAPYELWTQVLAALLAGRDDAGVSALCGDWAGDLARISSEIAARLPARKSPKPVDVDHARLRLLDAIAAFLQGAAAEGPLLVVLEDVQWADASSLGALASVAEAVAASPILFCLTYGEISAEPGSREGDRATLLLSNMESRGLLARIEIGLLPDDKVAKVAAGAAGDGKIPAEHVPAVCSAAAGNAMAAVLAGRLLGSGGLTAAGRGPAEAGPSAAVAALVSSLARGLSEDARDSLTAAAFLTDGFGGPLLEEMTRISRDRLANAVGELMDIGLLRELPGEAGRFGFTHVLIRDAIREGLPAMVKPLMHLKAGRAVEALVAESSASGTWELAYHYAWSLPEGEARDAVDHLVAAARCARDLLGVAEEEALTDIALDAASIAGSRVPEDERCELMLDLAAAHNRAGRYADAREAAGWAAETARRLGSSDYLARAALEQSWSLDAAGITDKAALAALEEALAALGEKETPLRARVLGRLAIQFAANSPEEMTPASFGEFEAERVKRAADALDLAERVGDRLALAYAVLGRQFATPLPDAAAERVGAANELVWLADETGDSEVALQAHIWRVAGLLEMGNAEAVQDEIAALARWGEKLDNPAARWLATLYSAMCAQVAGEFEKAEADAKSALDIGWEQHYPHAGKIFELQNYALIKEQGRPEELESTAMGLLEQYPSSAPWRAAAALLLAEVGKIDAARAELDRLAEGDFVQFHKDSAWLMGMSHLAQICAALGDEARAAVLFAQLEPFADRCVVGGSGAVCGGSIRRELGMLASILGRHDDAVAHLESAVETNSGMNSPQLAAHARASLAEALIRRASAGDRERAIELLSQALLAYKDLGMSRLLDRALFAKLEAQGVRSGDIEASIDAITLAIQDEKPNLAEHAAPDGTVTLLFADMGTYSALKTTISDVQAYPGLSTENEIMRKAIAEQGGYEVKAAADGFMVAFSSAQAAVDCALAAQRALTEHNRSHPKDALRIRAGLHTGEVLEPGGDAYSRHITMSAGIASCATLGEILVSASVKELVESGGAVQFGKARSVELKGITGKHEVFEVKT